MGKQSSWQWWSGWRLSRRPAHRGPDFADLGTAFGLDARLDADAATRSDKRLRPWADSDVLPTAADPGPSAR